MTRADSQRPGESELVIDGEAKTLRLTLGALAEIEESVGGGDFEALKARLASPAVRDILLILHALLAGGGARVPMEALKTAAIDFPQATKAIAEAFRGLSGEGEAPGKPQGASPGANGSSTE
ncbi:MAG TPA: GTA-gp10 family protein [Parvularculaceae bacterium]|nr:GTA-gp10 family protein [Parvularculaceae bacterium]